MGGKTGARHTSIKIDVGGALHKTRDYLAFVSLVHDVFDAPPEPPWPAVALFDAAGECVAGLQHARLDLSCDGVPMSVEGLRNVCVTPARRGRGLMRRLMDEVLAASDAAGTPTLLYTETPALYAGFGFVPVAQHAFEGPAPEPAGAATPPTPVDDALLRRLVETRMPVSRRCDLVEDAGLRLDRLRHPGNLELRFLETLDALAIIQREGGTLVLVDLVAPRVPSAAAVIGALGERPGRLRTLFSPDRLQWGGDAVPEDAGLMARGPWPGALAPFMLPPTVEF